MSTYWDGKRVTVCGGRGFLGRYLCAELTRRGAEVTSADRPVFDLSEMDDARDAVALRDVVINLAAHIVGGIGYAGENHAQMFYDNARLSHTILEAARKEKVSRFVVVSSACIYPDHCPVPMKESYGLVGLPASASMGYGYAKRMAEMQATLYRAKYGMDVVVARPFNAYGPGDTSSHVVPDLIRKVLKGGPLVIWGNGDQRRNLTYASDWVDALLHIAEHATDSDPINLAAWDGGVTINELAHRIIELLRVERSIEYGVGPIGHHDRIPDLSWLRTSGFTPKVSLGEGLKRTVEHWQATEAMLEPERHL
jgi:GDP-L-fucose synthase